MTVCIDLSERVVLVTGATGGVGGGIARRFADAGATIVVHGRSDPGAAARIAERLPGAGSVVEDLAEPAGPQRLISEVIERWGRLDVLVNNAGIQPVRTLLDMSRDEWQEMLDVNLSAVHRLSVAAAREMIAGGSIIHVASIEGRHPAIGHGHYAAAKAAVIMHARAAALEWGDRNIRVNTVSPGLIDRPGLETDWPDGVDRWHRAAPLTRLGRPGDIGNACVFLASDLAAWISGVDLVVDGGVTAGPTW